MRGFKLSTEDNRRVEDPQAAFERAIAAGRLSDDPTRSDYAGHYMYMGPTTDGKHDAFKHVFTREYLRGC